MKIAVFSHLPPGGAKRVVLEQIKGLSKNHEIDLYEIISTQAIELEVDKYIKNKYQYKFDLSNNLPSVFHRLFSDFKNFYLLKYLHKKIALKINYGNYTLALIHPDLYTQAPFLLRYLKIPNIYHCHELLRITYEKELEFKEDVIFYKKIYEEVTRKIRKKIDFENATSAKTIVTSSNYIKDKAWRVYRKKAFLCYPGVDYNFYKANKVKKKLFTRNILFMGGYSELKGYKFVKKIINLIEKKYRPNFQVFGFLKGKTIKSDKEVVKAYSHALVTLCVSHNEPFGLVALESMACATPVSGYLLPRNEKLFAEKIIYLIEHPKKCLDMGEKGRDYVIRKFNWEKHISCLESKIFRFAKTKAVNY